MMDAKTSKSLPGMSEWAERQDSLYQLYFCFLSQATGTGRMLSETDRLNEYQRNMNECEILSLIIPMLWTLSPDTLLWSCVSIGTCVVLVHSEVVSDVGVRSQKSFSKS